MEVEIVKATRGLTWARNGLITFQVEVPLYLWTEILTHRRFARNASSARAMSTDRYLGMGYYTPDVFYQASKGMKSKDEPIKYQHLARAIWYLTYKAASLSAKSLERLGVAKEQRNRLVPPVKIIRGLVTGTEDAWRHFLTLRASPEADKAMQWIAFVIQSKINGLDNPHSAVQWTYDNEHIPFDPREGSIHDRCMVAAARISRVSYARVEGKDDLASANSLIKNKHFSPFEHIAFYARNPGMSALFCKYGDSVVDGIVIPASNYGWLSGLGWKQYRAVVEK